MSKEEMLKELWKLSLEFREWIETKPTYEDMELELTSDNYYIRRCAERILKLHQTMRRKNIERKEDE